MATLWPTRPRGAKLVKIPILTKKGQNFLWTFFKSVLNFTLNCGICQTNLPSGVFNILDSTCHTTVPIGKYIFFSIWNQKSLIRHLFSSRWSHCIANLPAGGCLYFQHIISLLKYLCALHSPKTIRPPFSWVENLLELPSTALSSSYEYSTFFVWGQTSALLAAIFNFNSHRKRICINHNWDCQKLCSKISWISNDKLDSLKLFGLFSRKYFYLVHKASQLKFVSSVKQVRSIHRRQCTLFSFGSRKAASVLNQFW